MKNLGKNVETVLSREGKLFLTAENGILLKPYDFVEDGNASTDSDESRNDLRNALQDPENSHAVRTLYCFENGELKTISESVLNIKECGGAILYNTIEMLETVLLETMEIEDVQNVFAIDYGGENYAVKTDSAEVLRFSADAAEALAKVYYNEYGNAQMFSLYFTDDEVYLGEYNYEESGEVEAGTISVADISDGVIGNFTTIVDEAEIYGITDSAIYYMSNIVTEGYLHNSGDLNSYSGGGHRVLVQDISYIQKYGQTCGDGHHDSRKLKEKIAEAGI